MDKGLGKLDEREIDDLLLAQSVGRIGCSANGKTLVVPITYAYDGNRIIGHTGVGEKLAMMRQNPQVCFEVEDIRDLRNWATVVIQGRYVELHGNEASVALGFLVENILPKYPAAPPLPGMANVSLRPKADIGESDVVVFAIEIAEKQGRYEHREKSRVMSS